MWNVPALRSPAGDATADRFYHRFNLQQCISKELLTDLSFGVKLIRIEADPH